MIRRSSSSRGSSALNNQTFRRFGGFVPLSAFPEAMASASTMLFAVLPSPPGATVTETYLRMKCLPNANSRRGRVSGSFQTNGVAMIALLFSVVCSIVLIFSSKSATGSAITSVRASAFARPLAIIRLISTRRVLSLSFCGTLRGLRAPAARPLSIVLTQRGQSRPHPRATSCSRARASDSARAPAPTKVPKRNAASFRRLLRLPIGSSARSSSSD